jgi:hypothetical protein
MISDNRQFNFIGQLFLEKSHVLSSVSLPKDDQVNWLFLKYEDKFYSFIYKIKKPEDAKYKEYFECFLSFSMHDVVSKIIIINNVYYVFRGQEPIGNLKIIKSIL